MKKFAFFLALVFTNTTMALLLKVKVDARDLPRGLLSAQIEIPVKDQNLVVWYPKWIPGIHGPRGPVENLGGLYFSAEKKKLLWQRDRKDRYRFICKVPANTPKVKINLNYICNQPNVNSKSIDSYGNAQLGIINWNTCIVYPTGFSNRELQVQLQLQLPWQWKYATSLKAQRQQQQQILFAPVSLQEFIDSPLVCGKYLRSIPIHTKNFPTHYFHFATQTSAALQIPNTTIKQYQQMLIQAKKLFGVAHYKDYHFLVVLSDKIPDMGLEHLSSSLNGLGEKDFFENWKFDPWARHLLPHEYVHSWCGKYRRPKGMNTWNYHSPKDTYLLWVYEGLTQYLGELLTVRSGLLSKEKYLEQFSEKIKDLSDLKGRKWRALGDTAISAYLLRRRSHYWPELRRGQDYYQEGLLLWLEIDVRLRHLTKGQQTIKNFCRIFFGKKVQTQSLSFSLDEILSILHSLAKYDWGQLIKQRVNVPSTSLSLDFLKICGFKIHYSNRPSKYHQKLKKYWNYVEALDSLGITFDKYGKIARIIPDSLADRFGLAPKMQVLGVNGKHFSYEHFMNALKESYITRKIQFLLQQGETYRIVAIPYAQGPKYFTLTHIPEQQNLLMEILKPLD